MISVTVGQLVSSVEGIKNVLAAKLPIKAAYHLSRIGKKVQDELTVYEENRVKLIKEFGEEKDGQWSVTNDNVPAFAAQMNELLASEIKIDLEPLHLADLGDKAEVSASDLMACAAFVVE